MRHHKTHTHVSFRRRVSCATCALSENKRNTLLHLTRESKTLYHGQTSRLLQTCIKDAGIALSTMKLFAKENTTKLFKPSNIKARLHQRLRPEQLIKIETKYIVISIKGRQFPKQSWTKTNEKQINKSKQQQQRLI